MIARGQLAAGFGVGRLFNQPLPQFTSGSQGLLGLGRSRALVEEKPEVVLGRGEIAAVTRVIGSLRLQLAEDVVQEALVRALQTWPYRGVPENPAAWLTQTARNLALDHLRRERSWSEKENGISLEHDRWIAATGARQENEDTFTDDTLRMMFVCFHPELSTESQTALALRTLCGLSPAEIAAAFLTSEAAIAKRLVRARQRIRELALPFVVPAPHELPERLWEACRR